MVYKLKPSSLQLQIGKVRWNKIPNELMVALYVLRPWYKPPLKNQVKSLQYLKGNSREKSHKKISKCLDKPSKYLSFFYFIKNEPLNLQITGANVFSSFCRSKRSRERRFRRLNVTMLLAFTILGNCSFITLSCMKVLQYIYKVINPWTGLFLA